MRELDDKPFVAGDWVVAKPDKKWLVHRLHQVVRDPVRSSKHGSGWAYETDVDDGAGIRRDFVDSCYFKQATSSDLLREASRLREEALSLTRRAEELERAATQTESADG